jgi:hypothetical protein
MSLPRADEWTDPGPMDPPPRPRRIGRKLLAGIGLLVVAVVGSFLIWSAISLRGIPQIGVPFDTSSLGTVAIPDEENAFTYYRQAAAKFRDEPSMGGPYLSWSQASPLERAWLAANVDAMELWFIGTTKDRAVYHQPKDLRINSPIDVTHSLRRMIRLCHLVGLRMEAQGDLEEAWGWYRAGLRCSRHCGSNGGFIDRLTGMALYHQMDRAIRAWADHPNQSPSGLRRALDDLIAIDAMTPTFAENLRAEYFAFSRFLDEPGLSMRKIRREIVEAKSVPGQSPFAALMDEMKRQAFREPERSRRLIRLVWADWLSVAALPPGERPDRGHKLPHGYFYEPPADAPAPIRGLTPVALDRWVGSTLYLRAMLPSIDNVEKAEMGERAMRAALIVHLAEQLYTRENGHPPDSPDRLVGPYLKALPDGFVPPPANPATSR